MWFQFLYSFRGIDAHRHRSIKSIYIFTATSETLVVHLYGRSIHFSVIRQTEKHILDNMQNSIEIPPSSILDSTSQKKKKLFFFLLLHTSSPKHLKLYLFIYLFFVKLQDNEKKNILAVQTLRNAIMGSTLMATTSILLCSGLAAVISSTYSVKKPLNDAVYGAHGEFMVALKYVTLLTIFMFSFLCHSLSIRFINQVNILINAPMDPTVSFVTTEYVTELLEKGYVLNTVGNRLFYAALPLLLWIFGPVLVFLCSVTMVPVLYNLDFVLRRSEKGKSTVNGNVINVNDGGEYNNNVWTNKYYIV